MIRQFSCLVLVLIGFTNARVFKQEVEVTGEFVCPGPGIWPDPDNCQCFYNCANNIAYHDCCGDGSYFDIKYHDCQYANLVDCGDRPEPGSTRPPTTTGKPTSTTEADETTTEEVTTTAEEETTTEDDVTTKPDEPTTTEEIKTTPDLPTTTDPDKTTTTRAPSPGFPKKVLGMYILLADDFEAGFDSDAEWEPSLYPYQQTGANLLFFTFINPETMQVPKAFKKLSATRGSYTKGAVPADTLIIYAIGGYAYSLKPNPWDWLTTKEKAEAMAVKVAKWKDDYGIDGIDLDIEEGAGSNRVAGPNLLHFIRKIKSIHPDMIVSQPTYGYPQIQAEIDVINGSWKKGGAATGLADSIGLMVYEGTQALQYVKNFAAGSSQWDGFPIKVDVPKPQILVGSKGSSSASTINQLAQACVKDDLLGIMVWYCSVVNGLKYQVSWDCTGVTGSEQGFVAAMELFRKNM